MVVESTKRLLKAKMKHGNSLQPSEQDVVLHSTAVDNQLPQISSETVVSLSAITAGLLSEMLSPDAVWLAMRKAEGMAIKAGVSQEEFNRVKSNLNKFWAKKKAANPIGGMF